MRTKTAAMSIVSVVIRILIAFVVIIVIYGGATSCYDFGYRIFTEMPMSLEPGTDITVIINEGSSTRDMAESSDTEG